MKRDGFFTDEKFITPFQTQAWTQAWLTAWGEQPEAHISEPPFLYRTPFSIKGLFSLSSHQVVGSSSQTIRSIRSEYFRPVQSTEEFLGTAIAMTHHQLVLSDVIQNSGFHNAVLQYCDRHNLLLQEKNPATAYSVNTVDGSFTEYLKDLGSNTRLKLFNRRVRLATEGAISHTEATDVSAFINQLNQFHSDRWGKPCYQGNNLVFIKEFLARLPEEGHQVHCHELRIDDEVVSVLLDLRVGNRIYNLQSGFYEDQFKGVSLGTLHLGYQIENAFNLPDIAAYDFMAGAGKNTDYKTRLATQQIQLCDLVIAKSRLLAMLYQAQQKLQKSVERKSSLAG